MKPKTRSSKKAGTSKSGEDRPVMKSKATARAKPAGKKPAAKTKVRVRVKVKVKVPPKAKVKLKPRAQRKVKAKPAARPRSAAPAARKGLKESLRRDSIAAGKPRPEEAKAPEKGKPSPPPPTKLTKGPAYPPPPVAIPAAKLKPGQALAPAKPPRPTMPWPTGTSTAGLRVAAKDGILPPKPLQPPPPPPKRRILDNRPMGKIAKTDVLEKGIKVTLEDGRQLLLPYGLVGPEDISKVQIAFDGEGLSLHLRNGETLEYSLVRIRAMSAAFEEAP